MLASIAMFLVRNCMTALLLWVGLRTTPRALRATWSERRLVWRALLVLELGVPLLAILTVRLLPLPFLAAEVVAIMAVCPGAPFVYHRTHERAVVIVILGIVAVLAPLTIPIWLAVLDRILLPGHHVATRAIAEITIFKQIVPIAIGVVVAASWPRLARVLGHVAAGVFAVGLAIALVFVLVKGGAALARADLWSIAAVAIMVAGSVVMGRVAGRPRPDDERDLAITAALGNPGLGFAVITASVTSDHAFALMAAYVLARGLALAVIDGVGHMVRRSA